MKVAFDRREKDLNDIKPHINSTRNKLHLRKTNLESSPFESIWLVLAKLGSGRFSNGHTSFASMDA